MRLAAQLGTRREKQRGHAMLELALSAGVMVACLAGTFQFGYTFYLYNQLVTAVGNGGRYAATRTYRAATTGDVEAGKAAVRNMVVYGDSRPTPDAVPVVPHLTPEQVRVEWIEGPAGEPDRVAVSVTGYKVDAVLGEFMFNGRPAVEFPFVGRYAPSESEP
jgi:Flp pilus assembly protein TadG